MNTMVEALGSVELPDEKFVREVEEMDLMTLCVRANMEERSLEEINLQLRQARIRRDYINRILKSKMRELKVNALSTYSTIFVLQDNRLMMVESYPHYPSKEWEESRRKEMQKVVEPGQEASTT